MFAKRMLSRWMPLWNKSQTRRSIHRPIRLRLAPLEERAVPAALMVTSSADDGSAGTLRSIMAIADSNGEADTITFAGGVTSITLVTGQISLTTDVSNLSINGPGAASLTISGAAGAGANNRVFDINVAAGDPTISISGMTLANGNLNNTAGNNGAAIRINNDPVIIDGVTFNNNLTAATGTTSGGGAIAVVAATSVTINNSSFETNRASGTSATGGAIRLGAATTLILTNTSFGSNTATAAGGAINAATGISTITVDSCTFTSNQGSTGGAINNAVANTVFDVKSSTFTSNKSTGAGGALYTASSSNWQIDKCQFLNNQALSGGGGAARVTSNAVTFDISNSTFSGNTCTTTGGAIYFAGATTGTFPIVNSTFSNNTAGTSGGAFHISLGGIGAVYNVNNSTFSGNIANGNSSTTGGGAISAAVSITLNVNNSTIVNNTATGLSTGGGIRRATATGSTTIISTIVAKNTGSGGPDMNFSAGVSVNGGANLVGVSDAGNFTLATAAGINQTGSVALPLDPLVDVLTNNGGPTLTHKLKAGSKGVNNGNQNGLAFDQAGNPRPASGADIGSLESNPSTNIPLAIANAPNVPPAMSTFVVTVEYTDDMAIDLSTIDLNDITVSGVAFATPISPISKTPSGSGMSVSVDYEFNAPAGGWQWFHNGNYIIQMQKDQVFDMDGPNAVGEGPIGVFSVGLSLPPTFEVSSLGDTNDGNVSPGNLTLREAIALSNSTVGQLETITFNSSLNGMTMVLSGTAMSITDPVTIQGPGADNLTIRANLDRQFATMGITGASSTTVSNISGLTLSHFKSTGAGGVMTLGSNPVTFTAVKFTNNQSTTLGAVINLGATTVTMNDCTATANVATTNGGVIGTGSGTMVVNRSILSGNTATNNGGALYSTIAANFTVIDSTLSDNIANSASGGGGAISTTTGIVTITNSTISGNTAAGASGTGGAIRGTSSMTLNINNSTITRNTAAGNGGGLSFTGTTGTTQPIVNIKSTIIAQNFNAGHPDLYSAATSVTLNINADYSLIGLQPSTLNAIGTNLQQGVGTPIDAKLSTLGNYGGPTPTHGLLTGSPALDAGSNPLGLLVDQRGQTRSFDQPGVPDMSDGTFTDIGSFEGILVIPSAVATAPDVPPILGTVTVTVVYTDETGINGTKIDINDIKLSGVGYPVPVSPISAMPSGSGTTVTGTYVFNAPVGGWDGMDNGTYTITMQANEVFDTDTVPNAVPSGPIGSFKVAIPANYIVNQLGDIDDLDPNNGLMTLREAVRLSNASTGVTDSISFDSSIFGQTIFLSTSLSPTDSVIFNGPGADKMTISGNNSVRIMNLGTLNGLSITVSGLTLDMGKVTGNGASIDMAGDSTLTINDSVFKNGISTQTAGGIRSGASTGGSLIVRRSTFMNNSGNSGGAIFCRSALLIEDCLFVGNTSTDVAFGGGAVAVNGSGGPRSWVIRNSTFTNNSAVGDAGAIRWDGAAAGLLNIQNCTIVGNTANGTNGGGGITLSPTATGELILESSIVTNNIATASANSEITSTVAMVTANFSAITSATGIAVFNPDATTTSLLGQAIAMGTLSDNGGPTQTIPLLAGSLAINKGSNPASLMFDQRGKGFLRNDGAGVDIGAYEIQSAVAPPHVSAILYNGNMDPQRSLVTSIKVSFDSAVTIGSGAFVLERYGKGSVGTIGVVVTPMGNDAILTFDNTGSIMLDPGASLPDGQYQLTIVADNITGSGGSKLDGNMNGMSEGSPTDNVTSKVHRLFGDGNGDGSVTASDFNAFRLVYGSPGPSIFDFDGGGVSASDFNAFRLRYGLSGYTP